MTGCVSYNNKFNQKDFDKGGKAVVAFTQTNNASRSIPVITKLTFKDKNDKKITIASNKILESSMIPEGEYSLIGYELYGSESYGKTSAVVDLDFSGYAEASFSITSGQLVYLGQISTIIIKNNSNFISQMFGGISANDLEFKSILTDNFDKLDKDQVSKIEKETGLTFKNKPMIWKQVIKNVQ